MNALKHKCIVLITHTKLSDGCRCSSISKTRNSRKSIFKMLSPGPREKINDIKIDRIDFVWKFSYARQRVDGFSRLGVLGVTRFLLTNFI